MKILHIAIICLILLSFLPYLSESSSAASIASSGLKLWYYMSDTGNTLTDKSYSGNNGLSYGAAYDVLPSGAGSREFDGYNDYIQCNDSPGIDPVNGMTVEVLFRLGHMGGLQTLAGKSWSGATGDGYTLWVDSNYDLQFIVYDRNHNKVTVTARPGFNTQQWYHATAVFNGTSISLYVNGVKYGSAACNGLSPSDLDLTIGKYSPTSTGYFDGDIAVVRIYDRALNGTEIVNNYNADQWRVTSSLHPFLLFHNITEVPGYQNQGSSPWNGWEQGVIDSANVALTMNFSNPTWTLDRDSDNWVSARGMDAMNLGLAYQITKNQTYADKAKQALLNLDLGEVPSQPDSMIPEEYTAMSLLGYSLAYDWVEPTLDTGSDKIIRDKLATLADSVYLSLNWNNTKRSYITFCDFQGQAYPAVSIAGVVLHDYVNPHKLPLSSTPADWVKAGTDYYFVDDKLHDYNQSLFSFEVDGAGMDMMGAYKVYYIDDLAWWAQVYSHYYQRNFFNAYPLAKSALTSELWESLPNGYSNDFATDSNIIYAYQLGIANLLDMQNRSYVLKHYDQVNGSTLLPYSREAYHIYYDTELPDALLYLETLNYSLVTRANPPIYEPPGPRFSVPGDQGRMGE